MKMRSINLLYARLEDEIKMIGRYPLDKSLKLIDFGDEKEMKAITQRCYNNMKKDNLNVSAIDYLCIVSTFYLLRIMDNKGASREDMCYKLCLTDFAELMLMEYSDYPEEIKNFLRYFMKNPSFFLSEITGRAKKQEPRGQFKCFQLVSSFWYLINEYERQGKDPRINVKEIVNIIKTQ